MKGVSWPVVGQVAGLAAVVTGLFLLVGVGWAVLGGGALVVVWCTLAEVAAARAPRPPAVSGGGE